MQTLRIDYKCIRNGIANLLPSFKPAIYMEDRPVRLNISLLIETALLLIIAISAIKVFGGGSAIGAGWLITPGILVFAALIPITLRKRRFPDFGFNRSKIKLSLIILGWTCGILFPLTFFGLWVLKSFGLKPPLAPALSQGRDWIFWLFYQFMYVALSEELFFRGYLQSNILRLTTPSMSRRPRLHQWTAVAVSAACFAAAHIIIQGHILSVLIFFPGLVLGWLFIRTRSLLAPILFHGLANACYLVMAIVLT